MNQRDRIVKAASRIMSEKGYKGATFEEIAKEVGIHKSSLFHYFKDKHELLEAVIDIGNITRNLDWIMEDRSLTPLERLRLAIKNHVSLLAMHVDYVRVYNSETRYLDGKSKEKYLAARRYYASCFERIVIELQAEGKGYFEGLDPKVVGFGILGMCNWTAMWYRQDGRLAPEDIGEIYFRMLLGPVGATGYFKKDLPKRSADRPEVASEGGEKIDGGRHEGQQGGSHLYSG